MLREFFVNDNPKFLFKQFGLVHWIFITIPIIGCLIIYILRNKISRIDKRKINIVLKVSAIILLLNMLIYTFGNLYYNNFYIDKDLPFHLCFIANYMFMFGILFNQEWILKYTLFISFIGPIPAVLWPDLISTIDNYNFWQYIISHHFFIIISLFSYYSLNYRIEFKDYVKTFILVNIFMIVLIPFNKTFNTNYIFSSYIPDNVMIIYPWLKYFPPILILEVLGLLISGLVYFLIVKKRNKELDNSSF